MTASGRLALQVVPRMSDQHTDPTCIYGQSTTLPSQAPRSLLHYMPGCHSHACPAGHPLQGERGVARPEKMAQIRLEEGRLPLSFMDEDTRHQLERKEESTRNSLSCLSALGQAPSLRRARSSTTLKQNHHQELHQLKDDAATSWIFAVRGEVVRQKACDEVSEDFRRAGIGQCFRGSLSHFYVNSIPCSLVCIELL